MSGILITAAEIRTGLLLPALDSVAHNTAQQRLLLNFTPEVDSLVEWVASLRRFKVPADELRFGIHFCQQVIDSNLAEGNCTRQVTETADDLTRRAERARQGRAETSGESIKQLAARLRPALRVIREHHGLPHLSVHKAHCLVADVIAAESDDRLLGSSMQVALGATAYGQLVGLHAEHHTQAATA